MNRRRLLGRLLAGNLKNVDFADMVTLVEGYGFRKARSRGSHIVFAHPDCAVHLCLQSVNGQAKPYQIRQFLTLVERYGLRLEE